MTEPRTRKKGPPKKEGPIARNAGISLYPEEMAVLDRIKVAQGLTSRSDVVRWFIASPLGQDAAG